MRLRNGGQLRVPFHHLGGHWVTILRRLLQPEARARLVLGHTPPLCVQEAQGKLGIGAVHIDRSALGAASGDEPVGEGLRVVTVVVGVHAFLVLIGQGSGGDCL